MLAGREGRHLRLLIQSMWGEGRPDALAALLGSSSLLRHTLDRVRLGVPFERTVIAAIPPSADAVAAVLNGSPVRRVLVQPEDKGTAAAVLLATHWISWLDPDAIVAVFPSDQYVRQERLFMNHVADVAAAVRQHPRWIAVVAATPTEAEPDYGWIEPGDAAGRTPAGQPIGQVRRFWEKPTPQEARRFQDHGWLWSTAVVVARASRLLEVAGALLPHLHSRISMLYPFRNTVLEAPALQRAYAGATRESFARAVLEACPAGLMFSRLPPLTWSDWGTPGRVVRSLGVARLLPRAFEALADGDPLLPDAARGLARAGR